ncbi:hypothetical protein QC763_405670 [Podospora pseudopauciseta]|uniref:Uncharacterized protein n=1 Tax=Podospora pseudopauciseta TaxID=2093780 RepID=A0ABR0HEC5_9PEZI|nr:hypothetical protein QC763_405670 [Podospora pseudopauciseta]
MAVVKEFLFVNSGNKSSAGHKISTTGRAFVIRKARAAQPWSTKSKAGRKRAPFGSDDSPNATASSNSGGSDSPDGDPATNTLFDGKHSAGITEEVPVAVAPQRIQDDGNPKPKRGKGGVSKRQRPTAGVKPGQSKPTSSNGRFAGKFQEHHANNISDHVECVHCGYAVGLCICQAGATLVSQAQTLSGRLDPFGTVSVRMGQRDTDLLAYFNTVIIKTLTPLTGDQSPEAEKYWVTVSFGNSGFLHGVLCLSALQLAMAQPHKSPTLLEQFMHHRIQAISHIQAALADPSRALSDENIATVFQMLCIEENLFLYAGDSLKDHPAWKHLQPDVSQRQAHLAGLKRMLFLRGGIARLDGMKGLQAFIIRWVCTSLACRLVFSLPPPSHPGQYLYQPTNRNELSAAHLSDHTFAASHLLPHGLLKKLYNYPHSSPFYQAGSAMATACATLGVSRDLINHITTLDCLLRDALAWYISRPTSQWDALDIQNLMSIGLGELIHFILRAETSLSATENVIAICLFVFTFFVGNGAHAACSPLPGIMPRLRHHFTDAELSQNLKRIGIETWVGFVLLIASSQNPESEEFFFRFMVEMLGDRGVGDYEGFRGSMVDRGVWTPVVEAHAVKAWGELEGPLREYRSGRRGIWEVRRGGVEVGEEQGVSIPMSNPYATSHMKKIFSRDGEGVKVVV